MVEPGLELERNGAAFPSEAEIAAEDEAARLAEEVARQRRRRAAADILDAEAREPVAESDLDEFADTPAPAYLVPRMLYRDGLAVIFGAPGSGKSLLAFDIVLSLCAGKLWRGNRLVGRDGGRGVAHYVMAEGASINAYRMHGWLHHHGMKLDDLRGRFHPITRAFLLTTAGVSDYLVMVARDQPDLIVLDTRNLMFAGHESAGEDYGAMLRVLHSIREAAGGAAVVLIDHSGLSDQERTRGSNAQHGGVDTEIMVVDEHGHRTARVTRDKNVGVVGSEWHYTLQGVDEITRPAHVDAPPVCVPADAATRPTLPQGEWWAEECPDELREVIRARKGSGKAAALDIARLLRWISSEEGHTRAEIGTMLGQGPTVHAAASIHAGLTLLRKAGVTEPGGTPQRHVLVASWRKDDQ